MRKPLSMKRLTMLSANFIINLGEEKGRKVQQTLMDFLKYVWIHKEDDGLYELPKINKKHGK